MNNNKNIPTLALRGLLAFPGIQMAFDVGRKKSANAVNEAMKTDRLIFLCAQKDITVSEPAEKDMYKIGTVCEISQVLKTQNDGMRIMVEPLYRAKMHKLFDENDYLGAKVTKVKEIKANEEDLETVAIVRRLKEAYVDYTNFYNQRIKDLSLKVTSVKDLGKLCDTIAANMLIDTSEKQKILDERNVLLRLQILLNIILKENEILAINAQINERVHTALEKNQKEYYLREQIRQIQAELNDGEDSFSEAHAYHDKISALNVSDKIKEKLHKEADKLLRTSFGSPETAVIKNYLDTVLSIPFGVYSTETIDLKKTKLLLDKEHYGLEEVKKRIIEQLAVRKLNPDIKGQIMCLLGPPGTGKTSIASSVAKTLGREFVRVSLGGMHDEAEIRGHRKTYVGAMCGQIANAIINAKTLNPVILLDEIDKVGTDFKGDCQSALLEVLDPEQNVHFRDNFLEIELDLSSVLFITTANTVEKIARPLLDRMDVITLTSYTQLEKYNIAKEHLIKKAYKKCNITTKNLKISKEAIMLLVEGYTRESGVRELERTILRLCQKACVKIVENSNTLISITKDNVSDYLGPIIYKPDYASVKSQVGVVNGLAYTAVGGEMLSIEVNVMDGTGKLELTGSLGDVMKESAKAALSYVRSKCTELSIDKDFYKTKDIHIHVPEGAVSKDGPSAGVTIATALISALSDTPVLSSVAMTGEITLRGRVLPIGGLKEKTMAAYKNNIKTVIIPKDNESDLYDIANEIKEKIEFIAVSDISQVIDIALVKSEKIKPAYNNEAVKEFYNEFSQC